MATVSHSVGLGDGICLRGVVQGVGFRPFVYNLATRIEIRGFIRSSSSGVTIEAEGTEGALDEFPEALRSQAPPLARIEEITTVEPEPAGG